MNATRYTMEVMLRFTYTVAQDPERGLRHAALVTDLMARSIHFRDRSNNLMAQVQAMQETFNALSEERDQLGLDIQRAKENYKAFLASKSRDPAGIAQLRSELDDLEARHISNASRLEDYKAAFHALQ